MKKYAVIIEILLIAGLFWISPALAGDNNFDFSSGNNNSFGQGGAFGDGRGNNPQGNFGGNEFSGNGFGGG
jgi:hypothetical protein